MCDGQETEDGGWLPTIGDIGIIEEVVPHTAKGQKLTPGEQERLDSLSGKPWTPEGSRWFTTVLVETTNLEAYERPEMDAARLAPLEEPSGFPSIEDLKEVHLGLVPLVQQLQEEPRSAVHCTQDETRPLGVCIHAQASSRGR